MQKIVVVNNGIDPKEVKFNFFKNARTKTKLTFQSFSNIVTNVSSPITTSTPNVSIIIDNIITDINDGIAYKSYVIYGCKLNDVNNMSEESKVYLKELSNKLNNLSGSYKINSWGKRFDFDEKFEALGLGPESIDNKNQIESITNFCLPDKPIGKGAVWTVYNDEVEANNKIKNKVISSFYLKNIEMGKLNLKVMTNIIPGDSNKEENLSAANLVDGNSFATVSFDLATGDAEYKSDTMIKLSSYAEDIGKMDISYNIIYSSEFVA